METVVVDNFQGSTIYLFIFFIKLEEMKLMVNRYLRPNQSDIEPKTKRKIRWEVNNKQIILALFENQFYFHLFTSCPSNRCSGCLFLERQPFWQHLYQILEDIEVLPLLFLKTFSYCL